MDNSASFLSPKFTMAVAKMFRFLLALVPCLIPPALYGQPQETAGSASGQTLQTGAEPSQAGSESSQAGSDAPQVGGESSQAGGQSSLSESESSRGSTGSAQAASAAASWRRGRLAAHDLDLSFHTGWHGYREPALSMRLDGPQVGLRVRWAPDALQGGEIDFEAEVGSVDYQSRDSGFMNGSPRFRTSAALLAGPFPASFLPRPGLALTTEWTDLRGLTSTGAPGYERFNRSLWLVGQWRVEPLSLPGRPAVLQAGALLAGWHDSYLSQAGDYGDVTNRQRRGLALSLDAPWAFEGWQGSIGLRVQRYADSDLQLSRRLGQVYEPANRSFDVRLSVHY